MSRKPLTRFEVDTLRFFREVALGGDPCVPVPHAHFVQLRAALARRGLVLPDRSLDGVSDPASVVTEAGWASLAALPRLSRRVGCYDGCSRPMRAARLVRA